MSESPLHVSGQEEKIDDTDFYLEYVVHDSLLLLYLSGRAYYQTAANILYSVVAEYLAGEYL